MHLSDVLTAVAHGKHVLCEKPLAMDLGEAVQMVDAAQAARVLFGVAQCFRFERSLHRFRERIAAGEIGKPIFARAEFSYPAVQHARTWITDAAVSGGGPLADVGVHCIDALRYVLEDDPVSVQAFTQYDRHSGEVESAAVANLFFLRGTLATVLVSTRAEYRTPLEFVGTEGVLRAEYALNVEFPLRMELVKGGQIVDSEEILNEAVYAKQVDAFSAAVLQKAPFPVRGEEGARNQAILDAAYRSARTGQAESISYPY
jgi:predicted dehydrogenase